MCNHNFSKEGILHPDRVMQEYDLLYMQSGEWDVIEDEVTYHLMPGSVILLEPGKHHYSLEKCSPVMRNIYIHFEYEESDAAAANYCDIADKDECKKDADDNADCIIRIKKMTDTADNKEVQHLFEKVVDAFWSSETCTKDIKCSLALESLLVSLSDLSNEVNSRTDILISEIIHRFHCEPEKFLSPEELAENYNVSVRTISGRFKKQTGMSIHQYQLQVKLDMAYDLLPISPGRSLHDIALSYGFYDEFQFSKLFKRKFGISPSMRR